MQLKIRLIVMNFLEFAAWGAYLTCMGNYLGRVGMGGEIPLFYAIQGFVSIFMPTFLGEGIYKVIMDKEEGDWRAYNNAAILEINKYVVNGDNDGLTEGMKNLDKAAAISPSNGIILNNQGVGLFLQGKKAEAMQKFAEAAKATTNPVGQDYNLAMNQIQSGDYSAASLECDSFHRGCFWFCKPISAVYWQINHDFITYESFGMNEVPSFTSFDAESPIDFRYILNIYHMSASEVTWMAKRIVWLS